MNNITKKFTLITLIILVDALSSVVSSKEFINIEAEGNLETKYTIGCIPINQISNKYTPADIYAGFSQCAEEDNLVYGARLFFLAGTYGRFDTLRVTDKSAHQAVRALLIINFGKVEKEKIRTYMRKIKAKMLENDAEEKEKICLEIKEFGPPDYYPRYMIQHGLKALEKEHDGERALNEDFDAEEAWIASLEGYMHCNNI